MSNSFLQVHNDDDVLVALEDRHSGESIEHKGQSLKLVDDIPAKQKVALRDFAAGDRVKMYGIVVATAQREIRAGQLLTTSNVVHATDELRDIKSAPPWQAPDVSRWDG